VSGLAGRALNSDSNLSLADTAVSTLEFVMTAVSHPVKFLNIQ